MMQRTRFRVVIGLMLMLSDGALGATDGGATVSSSPLADTRWYLVGFQSMDDAQGQTANRRPLAYTMRLGADGRASLRLDCNRASGPWQSRTAGDSTTGSFRLGPLKHTRALCPDDALGPALTRDAPFIRSYRLVAGQLHLSLKADGGIYTWAPIEKPGFDCDRTDSSATELICTDGALATLDRELARLYARARTSPSLDDRARKMLVATQRGWIKGRDDCWKADDLRQCVLASMLMRVDELRTDAHVRRDPDGISRGPLPMRCDDPQLRVSVSFIASTQSYAYLRWNTEGIAMMATSTGSGTRYEGEFLGTPVTLWIKGNTAMIEHGDHTRVSCQLTSPEN